MWTSSMVATTLRAEATRLAPVARAERIISIDVLRGVAVLGILLVNILGFALPRAALDNPTVAGGDVGVDFWVWAVTTVLFEGKMRTIFSMLFGGSVVLLTGRLESRGHERAADLHLRRNLWLVLLGILHGYLLLWPGDVLYAYGLVGLPLFAFRRMRPRSLFLCGLTLLAVLVPKNLLSDRYLRTAVAGLEAVELATSAGRPLSEEQKASIEEWRAELAREQPGPDAIRREIEERRRGYLANVAVLAPRNALVQSTVFYNFMFFDVASMMLIGMGLYKLGVFSAARSYRTYTGMILAGYALGVPLGIWVLHDWVVVHEFRVGTRVWVFDDVARLAVALAHVGVVMIVCKAGILGPLTRRLAAVGQMALTNYILQSVMCGFLFYGYGAGLFGQLARHQLYYVVAAIWLVQIVASPMWLRFFRFGPLEWLWRSLTYQQWQPVRSRTTSAFVSPDMPGPGSPV